MFNPNSVLMKPTACAALLFSLAGAGAQAQNLSGNDLTLSGAITQNGIGMNDFSSTLSLFDGRMCIGNACDDSTVGAVGTGPLKLRWSQTDILFEDSSTTIGAQSNDWRIEINDGLGGGRFTVQDEETGNQIFNVEAGGPTNAMWIDDEGALGLGTKNPALNVHILATDTPSIRLDQSSAGGHSAYTWDIAGNDASFFVRDQISGTLPFRISPGAPTNAFMIGGDGFVGIGTLSPDYPLHVKRSNGTAQFRVEETSTSAGNLSLMFLDNAGGRARLQMKGAGNVAQTGDWSISAGNTFVLQERVAAFNVMIVDQAGNMTIGGALTQNSDKNSKMTIEPVAHDEILAKVASLPISAWTYKNDAERGIRHIGPMAQDFYAAFETGAGPTGISTIDTSGVALAAIKALAEENKTLVAGNEVLVADIKGLSQENAAQRDLIAQLAARLDVLEQQANR